MLSCRDCLIVCEFVRFIVYYVILDVFMLHVLSKYSTCIYFSDCMICNESLLWKDESNWINQYPPGKPNKERKKGT